MSQSAQQVSSPYHVIFSLCLLATDTLPDLSAMVSERFFGLRFSVEVWAGNMSSNKSVWSYRFKSWLEIKEETKTTLSGNTQALPAEMFVSQKSSRPDEVLEFESILYRESLVNLFEYHSKIITEDFICMQ